MCGKKAKKNIRLYANDLLYVSYLQTMLVLQCNYILMKLHQVPTHVIK